MQNISLKVLGAGVVLSLANVLGFLWTPLVADNLHAVIPGKVFRSAQLDPEDLARTIGELGLRSIINLRGLDQDAPWYLAEHRVAAAHGVELLNVPMRAERLPSRQVVRQLVDALRMAERPVLLHCMSGTDRSGLAAAVALLLDGHSPLRGREEFGLRHGYLAAFTRSELPDWLDLYEGWLVDRGFSHSPTRLVSFAQTGYTPYFYDAAIEPLVVPRSLEAGKPHAVSFQVTNRSPLPWSLPAGERSGVQLGLTVKSSDRGNDYQMSKRSNAEGETVAPGR